MSVTRFKVGDKVRVRDGLIGGRYYDGIYCTEDMANLKEVLTVCFAGRNAYKLEGYDLIEINGKKYKKADVEKAIKDLEVIE